MDLSSSASQACCTHAAFLSSSTPWTLSGSRSQRPVCPRTNATRRQSGRTRRTRRTTVHAAASPFDPNEDLYSILGLDPDASTQPITQATIKRAYRRSSLQSHPDVSKDPNARERFMKVQEAYKVLSDPRARARYDRQRARRARGGVASGTSAGFGSDGFGGTGFGAGDGFDFRDFWESATQADVDMDDSFGNILRDLFDQLGGGQKSGSGASGAPGFFEDFVEFLEKQTGMSNSGRRQDQGYESDTEEVVRSGDLDILERELEDAKFVVTQLRTRRARLLKDSAALEERIISDPRDELRKEAKRLRQRLSSIDTTLEKEEAKAKKLEDAISKIKNPEQPRTETASAKQPEPEEKEPARTNANSARSPPPPDPKGTSASSATSSPPPYPEDYKSRVERTKKDVDDELERLRNEMGL